MTSKSIGKDLAAKHIAEARAVLGGVTPSPSEQEVQEATKRLEELADDVAGMKIAIGLLNAYGAQDGPALAADLRTLLASHDHLSAENARLRGDDRMSTHGVGCAQWGPRHYECAIAEITSLQAAVASKDAALAKARDGVHREMRAAEMSSGIMLDPKRTGNWSGARRTADAFDRIGLRLAEVKASICAALNTGDQT